MISHLDNVYHSKKIDGSSSLFLCNLGSVILRIIACCCLEPFVCPLSAVLSVSTLHTQVGAACSTKIVLDLCDDLDQSRDIDIEVA